MNTKSIVGILVLSAAILLTGGKSFAQSGPCLLNVGNCQQANTTNNTNQESTKVGRYALNPALSADVVSHLNYGSRYLLKLSNPYPDPNGSGCYVEIRAWVAAVESNNGTQITVKVGTPRNVSICNGTNTPTVEQINQSEVSMASARKWITELSTNPTRYANAQAWINYYTNLINQTQKYIAQGAPN